MNGGAVQLHRGAIHLRREQYRSMPWRNGGGVTLEIARELPSSSAKPKDFCKRHTLRVRLSNGVTPSGTRSMRSYSPPTEMWPELPRRSRLRALF